MSSQIVQIRQAAGITADDLYNAYLLCELRRKGIGYQTALTTPCIAAALRGKAMAQKRLATKREARAGAAGIDLKG